MVSTLTRNVGLETEKDDDVVYYGHIEDCDNSRFHPSSSSSFSSFARAQGLRKGREGGPPRHQNLKIGQCFLLPSSISPSVESPAECWLVLPAHWQGWALLPKLATESELMSGWVDDLPVISS